MLTGKVCVLAGVADVSKRSVEFGARVIITEVYPLNDFQATNEDNQEFIFEDSCKCAQTFVASNSCRNIIRVGNFATNRAMRNESVMCNIGHFGIENDA